MTRRAFSAVLAGFASAIPLVPGKPRAGVIELRTYRGAKPGLAEHLDLIFPRAGIYPLRRENEGEELAYLIPFRDLAARHRAWTEVNADPQWRLAHPGFRSYHFTLY